MSGRIQRSNEIVPRSSTDGTGDTQSVSGAGPTQVLDGISLVEVTTGAAAAVVLPVNAPVNFRVLVMDVSGSGAANNISVTAPAGQTINLGAGASIINTNFGSREYVRLSATNWGVGSLT